MKYHHLGRTGLYVSELCLGTMTWGGKGFWETIGRLDAREAAAHLKIAVDAGVNFVDTADVYHEGLSEELLGAAVRSLGLRRDALVIATKVRGRTGPGPNDVGLSRVHVAAAIDASLRRLQMDHVDLYQIHGVDGATRLEETLEALDVAVRAGKVRYVGFCNLDGWRAAKALGLSDRYGWARFVSAQMFYAIAARDIEREIVPLAVEEGLGILPWSPLAGGLLTGKFHGGDATGSRRAAFDFPPVDRDRADRCIAALRPIAEAHGVSIARVALAWVLHQKHVTSVIIGARTEDQLRDNLAATAVTLSADELTALDAASALPQEYPGWMIGFQHRDRWLEGMDRP